MSDIEDLKLRLLRAVHEPDAEAELLAHEVAASEQAQVYLVELASTLSLLSPANPAIARASSLLEYAMAIVAEHALTTSDELDVSVKASAMARDPGDRRKR
jgi:hypothetical protein